MLFFLKKMFKYIFKIFPLFPTSSKFKFFLNNYTFDFLCCLELPFGNWVYITFSWTVYLEPSTITQKYTFLEPIFAVCRLW